MRGRKRSGRLGRSEKLKLLPRGLPVRLPRKNSKREKSGRRSWRRNERKKRRRSVPLSNSVLPPKTPDSLLRRALQVLRNVRKARTVPQRKSLQSQRLRLLLYLRRHLLVPRPTTFVHSRNGHCQPYPSLICPLCRLLQTRSLHLLLHCIPLELVWSLKQSTLLVCLMHRHRSASSDLVHPCSQLL